MSREKVRQPSQPDASLPCSLPPAIGYLSLLVREAFAHTPNATFVLEATTEKSRDRYSHFGFQVGAAIKDHNAHDRFPDPRLRHLLQLERPIVFGKGEFDSNGYRAKGESAEGFQIYAMVKVSYSALPYSERFDDRGGEQWTGS